MSKLPCAEVFRRLDDYLDRELSAEEMALVKQHLETCGDCASEHHFEAQVIDAIRAKLQRLDAPPSLVERIRGILDRERGQAGNDLG